VDAAASAMAGLRASNDALRARAAALAARNEGLAREFRAVEFLRWGLCGCEGFGGRSVGVRGAGLLGEGLWV